MASYILYLCVVYGFFGMILISKAEYFARKLIKVRMKLDQNFKDPEEDTLKKYFVSMKFVGYAVLAISVGVSGCFIFFNILIH